MQVYAFDILVSDGQDVSRLPLSIHTASLARLMARRVDGILLSDFEQGGNWSRSIPARLPDAAEGTVSKHRESMYRGGRFRHWIKVKNRQHPAFSRVADQF